MMHEENFEGDYEGCYDVWGEMKDSWVDYYTVHNKS
jgi:hypothetical protein